MLNWLYFIAMTVLYQLGFSFMVDEDRMVNKKGRRMPSFRYDSFDSVFVIEITIT
ncbi:hypothetical protein [Vibrio methylphosphonaticus]|uniref:hypothetical protein n=1 Tax=Vibrio methylphosphonaticus TaxID=2946866 RepID=UPI00202ABD09|nr:hypothetical protein [Vibrio methylphosphonaticus]MCL9776869.1 hypothetical protein [Vibrio methylphosphonaticus]